MHFDTGIGPFEFSWNTCPDGYEWKRADKNSPWTLVPASLRVEERRPLESNSGLFLSFSKQDGTKESFKQFAQENGLLQSRLADSSHGEELVYWIEAFSTMRDVVSLWEAIESANIETLKKRITAERGVLSCETYPDFIKRRGRVTYGGSYVLMLGAYRGQEPDQFEYLNAARVVLVYEINLGLRDLYESTKPMIILTRNSDLQLTLAPETLLAAMWLQLAQAASSHYALKLCPGCRNYFTAGAGNNPRSGAVGRRADAKVCSEACRKRVARLKADNIVQTKNRVKKLSTTRSDKR